MEKYLFKCEYCTKEWETTKFGFSYHVNHCMKNPKRKPLFWSGRHHSDETKKKISEGAKKAHVEGRGHTWKNRYLNPSYAEQWLYDVLDNAYIDYEKEKPYKGFFLDVVIGNKVIEIDGNQHYDLEKFPEQHERDLKKDKLLKEDGFLELRVKWSDVKTMPKYFAQKILEFIEKGETKFDGKFQKRQELLAEKKKERTLLLANGQVDKIGRLVKRMLNEDEWESRKKKILDCGVDLNKFGCISKIEKLTGMHRNTISKTLKHFGIEWKTHKY